METMTLSSTTSPSAPPSLKPIELSFPFPKTPHMTLHIHLTFMTTSTLVFLSATAPGDSGGSEVFGTGAETTAVLRPMGSFVHALPDRVNPRSTLSTALHTIPGNIDYATRMAKVLARKMNNPVYVGCSIDAMGSSVEEEMEGFARTVEVIMGEFQRRK